MREFQMLINPRDKRGTIRPEISGAEQWKSFRNGWST